MSESCGYSTKKSKHVISFHIVVNGLHIRWAAPNGKNIYQKQFWRSLGINEETMPEFDMSIYTAGRCFRAIGNTKPLEPKATWAKDKRKFSKLTYKGRLEGGCHLAQVIHEGSVRITPTSSDAQFEGSATPSGMLARVASASDTAGSFAAPPPLPVEEPEIADTLGEFEGGGGLSGFEYESDDEAIADDPSLMPTHTAKLKDRTDEISKLLCFIDPTCGEADWFKTANYLADAGMPEGPDGAYEFFECFIKWSQGLFHSPEIQSVIASDPQRYYNAESARTKFAHCVETYRGVQGRQIGVDYLIDLVPTPKRLEFRAVVRESYHRQLSDPDAQLYTDSLAESTLRRYPGTIMVAGDKKWYVPNGHNIYGQFDSGTKTFSPYIRGELCEDIDQSIKIVRKEWIKDQAVPAAFDTVEGSGDAEICVKCLCFTVHPDGRDVDQMKAASVTCCVCTGTVSSISGAYAKKAVEAAAKHCETRLNALFKLKKICKDEPQSIFKLIQNRAIEKTEDKSEFMAMMDIGTGAEGSLTHTFPFNNMLFISGIKMDAFTGSPIGIIKQTLRSSFRSARLEDCCVRTTGYDMPVGPGMRPAYKVEHMKKSATC